jgi:hypothetical protein
MGHVRSQSASYTLSMPSLPQLRNALYVYKEPYKRVMQMEEESGSSASLVLLSSFNIM